MFDFLDGKKTYVVAVAMILYGISGWYSAHLSQTDALKFIMDGFGLIFLRKGVAKIES